MSYTKRVEREPEQKPNAVDPTSRLCTAFGCPEVGSITGSTAGPAESCQWFCRFHFGTESHLWPEITRERRLAVKESKPAETNPYRGWTVEQHKAEQRRINAMPKPDGKAWAWKLRAREIAGESLALVQRENWRAALRGDPAAAMPTETEADIEARLEREAIQMEGA